MNVEFNSNPKANTDKVIYQHNQEDGKFKLIRTINSNIGLFEEVNLKNPKQIHLVSYPYSEMIVFH